jgi:cell division protein FtsL
MDQVLKITQAYSQIPWRKQIQSVGMFLVILVLCLVIAMIYVNVNAEAVAVGREIQDMQLAIKELEHSIADKQSQLAYITSAVEMEKRALEMHFHPLAPGDALYIVIPGYAGRSEAVLAPPSMPAVTRARTLSPEYSLSLVDWLKQELYLPISP